MVSASTSLRGSRAVRHWTGTKKWPALPVLIYLAAIVLPIGFNVGPLNLNILRLLLLVMIVPLTVNLFTGRYGRVIWTDILFYLHIFWMMVALIVNNPDRAVVFFGSQSIEFIGGYVLARAFIRTREDFIALCKGIVLVTCFLLPFAVIEAGTRRPLILLGIDALPGVFSASGTGTSESWGQAQRLGLYRAQTAFPHPILHGLFCATVFPLAFVALKGVYSMAGRYVLSAAVAACALLSLSAGPLLSMILVFMLIGWSHVLRGVRARWSLLVWLIVALYVVIDLLSNRTPIRVFLTYATFSPQTGWMRLIIFEWGMVNVWANPLFGIGLNDWVRPVWKSASMDNFWLVNAVRYGIPGFVFLALGYLIALWRIGRQNFDADPILWQLRRGWMFAFVGLSVTLATVHVWSSLYSFVFFMFGSGMWMFTAAPATGSEPAGTARPRRRALSPRRSQGAADRPSPEPVAARAAPAGSFARTGIALPRRPDLATAGDPPSTPGR